MAGRPDPKPEAPVRVKGALARMHESNPHATCALCDRGRANPDGISIHHVYDRSDLWQNCVFVCGDGVRGCHGSLTANNELARSLLGEHLVEERPDVIAFVLHRAGRTQGTEWLRRRLFLTI